nr:MAG TPA: hypothetical protein [Caudoviricetes sp.]
MASICGSPVCAGGKPKLKFTYTGDYVVRDDGVVELRSTGTLVFIDPAVIDVFMVGGGGKGGRCVMTNSAAYYTARGGGGGGYTRTLKRLAVQGSYEINIGAGSTAASVDGGSTAWGSAYTVLGGKSASEAPSAPTAAGPGMAGGSGGGGAVISNSDYGTGGSDGNSGEQGYFGTVAGGAGQGFTTREFGEATGKLYAGGGGGGRYMVSQTPIVSNGGAGGGGTGGWAGSSSGQLQAPAAGGANTGGGGGGAAANYSGGMQGGSGGSGIVCFRDAAELPELAGTWVLNERLYAPENDISENISFTATTSTLPADTRTCTAVSVSTQYVSIKPSTANWITAYNILVNKWINKYQTWTFPAGATASDEFRAWLASNATKQA